MSPDVAIKLILGRVTECFQRCRTCTCARLAARISEEDEQLESHDAGASGFEATSGTHNLRKQASNKLARRFQQQAGMSFTPRLDFHVH